VDTGLDPPHIPARRAYEAVGFDRQVPVVEYWQDLEQRNPGSVPEPECCKAVIAKEQSD
jgi:hypothetical protein